MNNSLKIAKEIEEKISELPEAQEYVRLKQIIDEDIEIQNLQKEIIKLTNEGKKEEADKLLSRLKSIPIIINFEIVKEQLADTLKTISNILK